MLTAQQHQVMLNNHRAETGIRPNVDAYTALNSRGLTQSGGHSILPTQQSSMPNLAGTVKKHGIAKPSLLYQVGSDSLEKYSVV